MLHNRRPPIVIATVAVLMAMLMVQPAFANDQAASSKVLRYANQFRHRHGLNPLREDGNVDLVSRRHSTAMANARTLFHSSNLMVKLRAENATRWGENIGYGPKLWGLFTAFVQSAPHRHNLLGSFRSVGIGVVHRNGCAWITMIFYA